MAHNHDHSHSHNVNLKQGGSHKAFIIGIVLNLVFVVAELVFGVATNSMALLSDAGHNASDVASLVLSLVSFWAARKKSSQVYTYGYKKTTVLAALTNAVILLIAIGIIGYESVMRLVVQEQAVHGTTIAWVAGGGIIINFVSAYLFYKEQNELNARSAYLHLMADALVSVGVVISGIVITYTNWYWLDPAIGLVVMVVILVSTWRLLKDSFKMSVDAVPSGIDLKEIKDVIANVKEVANVHHVHVWALSTTENALTAHVSVNEKLPFADKLNVVKEIKHELHHHNIQHSTIELDNSTP